MTQYSSHMKPLRALRFACIAILLFTTVAPAYFASEPANAQTSAKNQKKAKAKASPRKKATVKKRGAKRHRVLAPVRRGAVVSGVPFSALVVNAKTGEVLYERAADDERHPASLTKMMTLYLLFDALKKNKVEMDTLLPVTSKAASQPQTNINLTEGDRITVKTAVESLIVRSANDSAMVVAEALGGSEASFADLMNRKAKQLGMNRTHFENPNGLPDGEQVTCAYDMARLAIALRRDFPEYYDYFSIRRFNFRGQNYEGHNRLLGRFAGADGVKTGFIRASGFNLVTSAHRGDTYLIGVIIGGRTAASRDQQMMDMLDDVFAKRRTAGSSSHPPGRRGEESQTAHFGADTAPEEATAN